MRTLDMPTTLPNVLKRRVQHVLGYLVTDAELAVAQDHAARETSDYFDALANLGQSPGNAPGYVEVAWVLDWQRDNGEGA